MMPLMHHPFVHSDPSVLPDPDKFCHTVVRVHRCRFPVLLNNHHPKMMLQALKLLHQYPNSRPDP